MVTGEVVSYTRDGLRLAGERFVGDGAVGTVVLLHGGGQTRHSWARTAARLAADGWTVLALDARGHGDSDWAPAQEYTLDAFAGDLRAVLGTLDEPPVLVGASLGGLTALRVAGEDPQAARALVLVDVVVRIEMAGAERIHNFMSAHPDGFADLDAVADAVAAYNPQRPRPRNVDGLRKNVRLHEDGRWRWHWDPSFVRHTADPRRFLALEQLRHVARAVTVPTLLVRGGSSDVVSDAGVADLLELIPSAQVADVAAAGHMVAGDDNDVFSARLGAFLAGV